MRYRLNNEGMSLIELVVAGVVLAVLVGVATSSWMKYRARLNQQEAKLWLANLYVAERSYAVDSYNYTSCLLRIGIFPGDGTEVNGAGNYRADAAPHYARGFPNATATNTGCGPSPAGPYTLSCANIQFNPTVGCKDAAGGAFAAGSLTTGTEAQNTLPNIYRAVTRENQSVGFPTEADFPATTLNHSAFTAAAVGNIWSGGTTLDIWTVDENKKIFNAQSAF